MNGHLVPLLLLDGTDMSGLALIYGIVVWGGALGVGGLLLAFLRARDRRVAWFCYGLAGLIVFPVFACVSNHTVPADYVGGYVELVGAPFDALRDPEYGLGERLAMFLLTAPAPLVVLLVIGAPFVRRRLHPAPLRAAPIPRCSSCGEQFPSMYYLVEKEGSMLCRRCADNGGSGPTIA